MELVANWHCLSPSGRDAVLALASLFGASSMLRNDLRISGRGCNSRRIHYLGQLTRPESQ